MLFVVMVCFLLLLSYMCRMATNLFGKAVPASTRRATYTLYKLAAREYEELAWQILKSGILVYFNTLRFAFTWLAFAVVFAMACAMALAVALIAVALGYMGFFFHICALSWEHGFWMDCCSFRKDWEGLLLVPVRLLLPPSSFQIDLP